MSEKTVCQCTEEDDNWGGLVLFGIPVALVSFVFLLFAYWVSKTDVKYRTLRLATMPFGFIAGNVLMIMPVLAFCAFRMFRGWDAGFEIATDLLMLESVGMRLLVLPFWGMVTGIGGDLGPWQINPNGTDPGLIILFQAFVWFLTSKWINRSVAMALYDRRTVNLAHEHGVTPTEMRIERAKNDPSYVKVAVWYENRGKVPPVGALWIMGAGGRPSEFYGM